MPSLEINILAIIVAVVAHQALGFLWYGPLFSKQWLAGMGKTADQLGNPGKAMAISTIATLVMALALASLLSMAPNRELGTALVVALIAGVGLVGASKTTSWAYEGGSSTVNALFIGYEVIGLVLMAAILSIWR